jgi:HK97 family phage major capsid protein
MNKPLDTASEDYQAIYSKYLLRGRNMLTDAETRAISVGTGGAVIAGASWATFIDNAMTQDTLISRAQRVETTTSFTQPVLTTTNTLNTGVAEASLGTGGSPLFTKTSQGTGTSVTEYTFSLNKVTSWVKVSNELLNDSQAGQDVEAFLQRELTSKMITEINRQMVVGAGSTECQGVYNSARNYVRTAATGVATTNTIKDVLSAAWLSGASSDSPMDYESWRNCVAVINSRALGSWDPSAYPILFPTMSGAMKTGTVYEGLPVVYQRLTTNASIASGEPLVCFADFTKYLLATNIGGFSVARYDETFADTNQTLFVGSVRADGALLNAAGVLNITRS